jgi:hypothetical protein
MQVMMLRMTACCLSWRKGKGKGKGKSKSKDKGKGKGKGKDKSRSFDSPPPTFTPKNQDRSLGTPVAEEYAWGPVR